MVMARAIRVNSEFGGSADGCQAVPGFFTREVEALLDFLRSQRVRSRDVGSKCPPLLVFRRVSGNCSEPRASQRGVRLSRPHGTPASAIGPSRLVAAAPRFATEASQ
jgi:hypothetical protein